MTHLPFFLQQRQVKNTATLLAKQYRTFSSLYDDPLEAQEKIFTHLIHYRYHKQKNSTKQQVLLQEASTLLDLRELIIEILDQEHHFNQLPIKTQCTLEELIIEHLNEQEIYC